MRAVALMHVEVDHEHALQAARGAQRAGRGDDVVEEAEAAAAVGKRVMRAAAEVRARAVGERRRRGLQRGADRAPGALDERRRPGQSERPQLVSRELAALGSLDPVGRVREQQLGARRGARVLHLEARLQRRALAQQRVLAQRKAMAGRQRVREAVVRVAAQGGLSLAATRRRRRRARGRSCTPHRPRAGSRRASPPPRACRCARAARGAAPPPGSARGRRNSPRTAC